MTPETPAAAAPVALLVFGMHRSGTSALTGMLERLGVPVPGDLLPPAADNPTGFFENRAVNRFLDGVLAQLGASWDDPLPLDDGFLRTPAGEGIVRGLAAVISAEFVETHSLFAVKDPRMSRFVPLWRAALDRLGVESRALLTLRHPLEIAASLAKRDGLSRPKSLLLWLQHVLPAERDTRDIPRTLVAYDALLADWRGAADRISADLDLHWPKERVRAEHEVDAFLSTDLRHHARTPDLRDATRLDTLVGMAWRALLALTQNRDDAQAKAILDSVHAEVADASSVLASYVTSEVRTLTKAVESWTLQKLTADHHLNLERIARAQEQASRAEAEGRLRGAVKDGRARLVRAEKQVRAFQGELEGLRPLASEVARLRPIEAETHRLRDEIGDVRGVLSDLQDENRALAASLNAIRSSTLWRSVQPLVAVGRRLPGPLRRQLMRSAQLGWWMATPWRMTKRLESLRGPAPASASDPTAADPRPLSPADPEAADASAALPVTSGDRVQPGYAGWIEARDRFDAADAEAIQRHIETFEYRPTFSVVVPVFNAPELTLREMIVSVLGQIYPHWDLCIADDASTEPHVRAVLEEFAARDPRIRIVLRDANGHISAATNSALEIATGEFVALLDHDDLLAPHALYEVAAALNDDPKLDILYSDEDKIDDSGERFDIYFKPSFSPDLLLGQNVISHLGVYRRSLVEQVGGLRLGFEGSQDYDLALRAVTATERDRVRHIPEVLYHWRQEWDGTSFSQGNLERCTSAARAAIQEQLDAGRFGIGGKVLAAPLVPSWNRVLWDMPSPRPKVDIIIPTRDRVDLLRDCLRGLLERTSYRDIHVTVVDNNSQETETLAFLRQVAAEHVNVSVLRDEGEFNYPRLNNEAVRRTNGEVVLLLNNDIDVLHHDWLDELVRQVMRPDIGVVGAKLLYPDGTVQHAGVRLGAGTFDGGAGVAGHVGLRRRADDGGYLGHLALARDVGAVTAACLAVRRDVYEAIGGLDEQNLAVAFNDVDFCLRVREAGYRVLWTPFAELTHRESASRGTDASGEKARRFRQECEYMVRRWGEVLAHDPFYNPHFDNEVDDWAPSLEPRLRTWDHML